jgi:Phage tail tube protein
MAFQSENNVVVAYKPEGTFGVKAAGGAGAKVFRLNGGGLGLDRALIQSNELRSDLRSSAARYGSRNVNGGYPADLSVGTFDELIEAAFRSTWTAASAITAATFTTLTPAANTFTAASGSFLTQGFRVGQVVRRTGSAIAGNNGRNIRVVGVTTSVLTVAETLTGGAADATGSLDIQKRIIQAPSIVKRSFTFEEYEKDVDGSEIFVGAKISSLHLSGGPDAMAIIEFGIVGADGEVLDDTTSPYFTGPVATTSIGLTLADAKIRFGGEDVAVLSAFDATLDNRQGGQAVIGGGVTPEIFEGSSTLAGSISGIRRNLTNITRYLAESPLELHVLLTEPGAEPKPYFSLFLPNIKLGRPTKQYGSGSAMIETMPFTGSNKDATTGYDDTMIQAETSAA